LKLFLKLIKLSGITLCCTFDRPFILYLCSNWNASIW